MQTLIPLSCVLLTDAGRTVGGRRPAGRESARLGLGGLGLPGLFRGLAFFRQGVGFRAVEQADQRERRVVALAETGLQDAQIAAVALGIARAEVAEQLRDDIAVAQPVESE